MGLSHRNSHITVRLGCRLRDRVGVQGVLNAFFLNSLMGGANRSEVRDLQALVKSSQRRGQWGGGESNWDSSALLGALQGRVLCMGRWAASQTRFLGTWVLTALLSECCVPKLFNAHF